MPARLINRTDHL